MARVGFFLFIVPVHCKIEGTPVGVLRYDFQDYSSDVKLLLSHHLPGIVCSQPF